jgi:molecular chaperone HtpG
VLPVASNPLERGGHRVYLKGMLLSESASKLLPEWAFFARCVVDSEALRPTASREALYDDETLAAVRDALGDRIRDWLTGLAATEPDRLERFLAVHQLGVKALAVHDDELLRTMLPWLRFETTAGMLSLSELARRHPVVHLARTVEEFRQVAAIASAQGLGLVNGGYTYDAELVEKLPSVAPGTSVIPLAADAVVAHLDAVPADRELALAAFLTGARARLDRLDCDVVLRMFHPVTVPALYLDSRDALHERSRAQAEAEADPLWTEILSNLRSTVPRAQLVLNDLNPVVRTVAALREPDLRGTAVDALYGQALLMTHRPLRTTESALLNRALGDLLTWAADQTRTREP